MERQSSLDEAQILKRAQHGDAAAIATALNHFFHRRSAHASVTWKADDLLILLDCSASLPQHPTTLFIRQVMQRLNLGRLQTVHLYARRQEHADMAWAAAIEMKPGLTIDPTLALLDWLHQGQLSKPLDPQSRQSFDPMKSAKPAAAATSRFLSVSIATDQTVTKQDSQAEALFLLPLNGIRDVFYLALHHILSIPDVPSYVLGVYHHRGQMMWICDLAQRLGVASTISANLSSNATPMVVPSGLSTSSPSVLELMALQQSDEYPILAIQSGEDTVGFLVSQINDIETYLTDQIRQPDSLLFPSQLMPFLAGYHAQSTCPVLSPQSLAMTAVA